MKIQPISSPHATQSAPHPTGVTDSKARAMAAFNASAAQQQQAAQPVVSNQNSVAPEEMNAIRQPPPKAEETPISTEEASAPEAPPEAAPPQRPEDQARSQEWAKLARQEKLLRAKAQQQDQALKAREAQLAAREAELASKDTQYKSDYIPKSMLKNNVLQALAEAGTSYEEIAQQIINQQPTDPRVEATISRLEAKIQELENKNEQNRKASEDQQSQAYQAALKQIRLDVDKLIKHDPNFETIKATGSAKDVVDLIEQTYKEDGELLSVEEASQKVEDYLIEEAIKFTKIGKIKQRLGMNAQSAPSTSEKKPQSTEQQTQPTMKTLTNNNSSTRRLTAKERAILAFKGELKTS